MTLAATTSVASGRTAPASRDAGRRAVSPPPTTSACGQRAATPGSNRWYAGRAAAAAIRVGGVRDAMAGRIGSWV